MVKHFPEFRRQVDDTTRRPLAEAHSPGGTGRPSMALDSRTPTPEKGGPSRPCESFSLIIPGTRSVRPRRVSTEPESTGEAAGRCGVGSLFPRSFAGRSIRPPRSPLQGRASSRRKARAGITTLGLIRGTPAAGETHFGRRCGSRRHRATRRPKTREHQCSHPASGSAGAATETGTSGGSVPPARILSL